MTTAEKKEFLWTFRAAYLAAEDARRRLEEFRARHEGLRAIAMDSMPHGGNLRDMSDMVAELDALEAELAARIKRYKAEMLVVEQAIGTVDEPHLRRLLWLHYIDFKRFEEIACLMSYSYRQTIRAHRRAIEALKL